MPSPQNRPTRHWFKKSFYLAVLMLWVVALPLVFINRQDIIDWWRLRTYQPPAAIASISQQDTMTDYGTKVFYVNEPTITGKGKFNEVCPNSVAEQTIVLGCYHGGQSGIYIYDVTDQRLDGVEQVTAAHEMLHAAYDRLTGKQRADINALLEDYYQNGLNDQRIIKTIDTYKKTEPNDVANEMHSIFGTEISNLPTPLERHYEKYFNDRSQVVAFANKYQAEFTSRQDAVARYDTHLATIKSLIDSMESDLKSRESAISKQQKDLIALRNSGNTQAYNAGVLGYNASVEAYNAEVQQLRGLVSRYNETVATRNSIALEENELAKSLNSNAQIINN